MPKCYCGPTLVFKEGTPHLRPVFVHGFRPKGRDDNAEGMVSGAASAMRGSACSDFVSCGSSLPRCLRLEVPVTYRSTIMRYSTLVADMHHGVI